MKLIAVSAMVMCSLFGCGESPREAYTKSARSQIQLWGAVNEVAGAVTDEYTKFQDERFEKPSQDWLAAMSSAKQSLEATQAVVDAAAGGSPELYSRARAANSAFYELASSLEGDLDRLAQLNSNGRLTTVIERLRQELKATRAVADQAQRSLQ